MSAADRGGSPEERLARVEQAVIACRKCPRLVQYREEVARTKRRAFRDWTYWGRPVPGFGDAQAKLLIVGLAPGRSRRQSHRPHVHRRPLRRLSLRAALPRRIRQPAHLGPAQATDWSFATPIISARGALRPTR